MLGRPAAVVGSSRMVFVPAFSAEFTALVVQFVQVPVDSKETVPTLTPLTIRLAGRAAALVWPLANRTPSDFVPAAGAVTVNSV